MQTSYSISGMLAGSLFIWLMLFGRVSKADMIIGFSPDGLVSQFNPNTNMVDVPIYLIQRGGESRLTDDGIISFGLSGRFQSGAVVVDGFTFSNQFPDFQEITLAADSFKLFGNVPFNFGGPNPGLVPAKGESILLGTLNLRTTDNGSTLFRIGDYDPENPSFSDFSFAGAASVDSLDHLLFNTDAQRNYTFTVNQLNAVPEPMGLIAVWTLATLIITGRCFKPVTTQRPERLALDDSTWQ